MPDTPSLPLPPTPTGHLSDASTPTLLLNSGRDLAQIVGEDEGRPRAVGAMDEGDVGGWQRDAGVEFHERRIVPLLDLAEHDVGEQRAGELQRLGHLRQVVDRHDRAEHGGEVQDLARRRLELFVLHRLVRGAEEHGAAGQLADARARSQRLIVDARRSGAAC